MSQYQRLLLVIDPAARHSPAILRAAALARASGASLHIAALLKPAAILALFDHKTGAEARERHRLEHRHWLQEQVQRLRGQGVTVSGEVAWADDLLEEILQHVAELEPDLLIKDVQHEPALKRAFLTPMDWHLLRQCPVPLYLVGREGHALPRKVAAAVDPSRPESRHNGLNERIIDAANSLALQCDAELHLLHACDVSSVYLGDAGGGGLTLADLTHELRTTLERAFLELAERYGVPPERRHFILGQPVTVLARFVAEQQADVLVMGRVHRQGLEKLVGSTTEHALYQVPCSLLAL